MCDCNPCPRIAVHANAIKSATGDFPRAILWGFKFIVAVKLNPIGLHRLWPCGLKQAVKIELMFGIFL